VTSTTRGDAACLGVDRPSGLQRAKQRRRRLRLDPDDPDPPSVPRGDAADQPAAADRDEKRVEIGELFFDLAAERRLPKQCLALVEGMDRRGAGLRRPGLARGKRVVVALTADDEIGAIAANARYLDGRGGVRHEDPGGNPEALRGERDCRAVVAARGRDDPGRRHGPGQQVREGAAHLERARMLQLFELEGDPGGRHAEIGSVQREDRRAPQVRPDRCLDVEDRCAIYRSFGYRHSPSSAIRYSRRAHV
jgi:hypothetical protein